MELMSSNNESNKYCHCGRKSRTKNTFDYIPKLVNLLRDPKVCEYTTSLKSLPEFT